MQRILRSNNRPAGYGWNQPIIKVIHLTGVQTADRGHVDYHSIDQFNPVIFTQDADCSQLVKIIHSQGVNAWDKLHGNSSSSMTPAL